MKERVGDVNDRGRTMTKTVSSGRYRGRNEYKQSEGCFGEVSCFFSL